MATAPPTLEVRKWFKSHYIENLVIILNTVIFVLGPIFIEIQTKTQFWGAKIHTVGERKRGRVRKLCIFTKGDLINNFQKKNR